MDPIPTPANPFSAAALSLFDWFFLPGDWLIYFVASRAPWAAEPLGLGAADYGGTLSAAVSGLAWLALALAAIAAAGAVRRLDERLTRSIAAAVDEVRRRVRMALAFARYRRQRRAERIEPSFEVGELPELRSDELRVLALHARLAPGFALTADDVAEELDRRTHEIGAVLERLQKLGLVRATVGGLDGETAYTLTAAGRGVLQVQRNAARPRPA
jgi:DNA-binding MarR family transcriptional regulator